jgi:H-NS histone family protein
MAGRGARPRWLVGLLKRGRKLDEFAIGKASGYSGPPNYKQAWRATLSAVEGRSG